jgi:hypothetical protein
MVAVRFVIILINILAILAIDIIQRLIYATIILLMGVYV